MELLDSDRKQMDPTGKTLGIIAGIFYLMGGLTCLVGAYASWLSFSAINRSGAPDATQLSQGIKIALYAQLLAIITLLIGIICQRIAFYKYNYSPIWLWWILLLSSISAVLGCIIPFNPLVLIIAAMTLTHVFTKKTFYREFEEE